MPYEITGWRQQGIAGVGGSGWANRNDIILVSWHSDDETRARLTVMNKTTNKQRFVELVRPCDDADGYCYLGATTTANCYTAHAGGLAWYKNTLFLADTQCIIAFDVNNLFELPNGNFVLPTTHFWKQNSTSLEYSTIGIDLSGTTPRLLVAEYISGCTSSNVGSWDIDPATGSLKLDSGSTTKATSDSLYSTTVCGIQGVAYQNGMYYLSMSNGGTDYMYRIRVLASAPPDRRYVMPLNTPQGLYIDSAKNTMWGMTEGHGSDNNCRVFSWALTSVTE